MTVLPPTRITATFAYVGTGSIIDAAMAALDREAQKIDKKKKVLGIAQIHMGPICTVEGDIA